MQYTIFLLPSQSSSGSWLLCYNKCVDNSIVEEIKHKLDIVDVIGHYVTLKRSGITYKANCPFHTEKTPSFMVNRERQLYRCFGCGESGDMIAFVMKQENVDFPNALKLLAGQAGVIIPESYKKGSGPDTPTTGLYDINQLALKFFHQVLTKHDFGQEARHYLEGRGVSVASIERFAIGYAPVGNQAIQALIAKHGHSPTLLRDAGSPERFRDRIMFPFRDVIGRVVGFSGRSLHDQMPKYLNTAETKIFRKNRFIYGLYEAKKAIGTEGKIIMVEGQLDLVLAHQVGTENTVAVSGTALSDDHLVTLRRYADVLYLAFDNDGAGQKATERAIGLALKHEFDVQVVLLPDGSDPGEVASKDPDAWRKALASPQPAIQWLFSYYFPQSEKRPTSSQRAKIFDALFPYIATQTDVVTQSYNLQHLGRLLGLQQGDAMAESFRAWQQKKKGTETESRPVAAKPTVVPEDTSEEKQRERSLVGLLLIQPSLLSYSELRLKDTDFTNDSLKKLYTAITSWYNENTNKSPQDLISSIEKILSPAIAQSLQKLLFDIQAQTEGYSPEQFVQDYSFLVHVIRRKQREDQIQTFASLLAQAESSNNREQMHELMRNIQETLKKEPHA